jgi:hypothetical protein
VGGGLEEADLSQLLAPEEAAAFERLAAAGRLSHLLPPWRPWWEAPEAAELRVGPGGQRLVAPAGGGGGASSSGSGAGGAAARLPEPPPRALPSLASLTRRRPSPLLRYQAVQLLYAYCFLLRRFNGDPAGASPLEAAQLLLLLAPPLEAAHAAREGEEGTQRHGPDAAPGSGAEEPEGDEGGAAAAAAGPRDVASALRACALAACAPPRGGPDARPLSLATAADVAALLRLGRPALVVALTDLGRLAASCGAAAAAARDAPGVRGAARAEAARLRRSLKAAAQKLLFFSAWANEQLPEVWEALAFAAEHAHGAREGPRWRRGAGGIEAAVTVVEGAAGAAAVPRGGGGGGGGGGRAAGGRLVSVVASSSAGQVADGAGRAVALPQQSAQAQDEEWAAAAQPAPQQQQALPKQAASPKPQPQPPAGLPPAELPPDFDLHGLD